MEWRMYGMYRMIKLEYTPVWLIVQATDTPE